MSNAPAPPAGFALPDFSAPLDVDKYVEACPPDVMTRGMFFQDIANALEQRKLPVNTTKKYAAFGQYPAREFIKIAADAAGKIFPGVPARAGLCHLGRLAYPTFKETMIGKVMYGVLSNDVEKIMKIAPRGYPAALSSANVTIVTIGKDHCHFNLKGMFTFVDSYQLGVVEGVPMSCGAIPRISAKILGPAEAEIFVSWHYPK